MNENLSEKKKKKNKPYGWIALLLLIPDGVTIIYAVSRKHVALAQAAVLAALLLILFGGARLTRVFGLAPNDESEVSPNSDQSKREKNRDIWLMRLVAVAALGLGVVTLYAIQYENWPPARVASIASVGLMAAGASWLAGALLGFLFGIPHTRLGDHEQRPVPKLTPEESLTTRARLYQASTSLEQISDWLTKIIVGVGLTKLTEIPRRLDALAIYIATGMSSPMNKTLGLSIFVYFSICGFLFGFLWARLYMLEEFERAGGS